MPAHPDPCLELNRSRGKTIDKKHTEIAGKLDSVPPSPSRLRVEPALGSWRHHFSPHVHQSSNNSAASKESRISRQ